MSRTLLFLPGTGADPQFWKPLGDMLPASWTKVYLGWPGLGDQAPDPSVNGFGDLIAMVERHFGDGPIDLLAQSMGGAIALNVALRQPGRVRKLVLAATSGGIDVAGLGGQDWRDDYRRAFPRAANWITEPVDDLTEMLHKLNHPTLLLSGEVDALSPPSVGRRLKELLPRATLKIVPNADHGFVWERPGEIVADIRSHLE